MWVSDMEWKDDEKWMYARAHEVAASREFPATGMASGGGPVNPGLSVAVFALIASFTSDPLSMNRVVQITNVAAVLCFVWFGLRYVQEKDRTVWLWGMALASVSPLAVLFSRKIWAQDLLPMLSFAIVLSNAHRRHPLGALMWGLTGALAGQIHMSAFFFAAGLVAASWIHDRHGGHRCRWSYWFAGSVLGSLTLIPWLLFLFETPQLSRQSVRYIPQLNFYLFWFLDAHGLNLFYSMRDEFWQFIREPIVGGVATFGVAGLHVFLVSVGIVTIVTLLKRGWNVLGHIRTRSAATLFGDMTTTNLHLLATFLGLGVLMSLSGIDIQPHYLICVFPLPYIWLVKVLSTRRHLVKGVVLAQLVTTVMFLLYVHRHGGVAQGDYGTAYRVQVAAGGQ
jgi:hypothetical protein